MSPSWWPISFFLSIVYFISFNIYNGYFEIFIKFDMCPLKVSIACAIGHTLLCTGHTSLFVYFGVSNRFIVVVCLLMYLMIWLDYFIDFGNIL